MSGWLWSNREWVFSGIGVFVLGGVVWIVRRVLSRASATKVQTQRSGHGSTNIQAGRDITIGDGGKHGRQ